jgi:hypothetical protein
MKKQLLIAAVAATMGTAAIADVSISGAMKVNYTNKDANGSITNWVKHEANLYVDGKSGDTSVHMEMNMDETDGDNTESAVGILMEDVWLSTKIADVTVKTGTWNGSDSLMSKDTDRASGQYSVSGDVAGVSITVTGETANSSTGTTLAGTIAGAKVSWKNESHQDQVKVSGEISGVKIAFHNLDADAANSDKQSLQVSTTFNGVELTYATVTAEDSATISGDSYLGNAATYTVGSGTGMSTNDDISGFGLKTTLAGNTVQAKLIKIEDRSTAKDVDIAKVVFTRALAGGTTFEATYTDTDNDGTTNDSEILDLELAVKF